MFRIDDLNRFTHKDNKKVEIELLLMSIGQLVSNRNKTVHTELKINKKHCKNTSKYYFFILLLLQAA
jgi:hypothetical protein